MNVPVDDESLRLIEESLNAGYSVDEEGTHTLVGAEFSLHQLLEFWSGYDPSLLQKIGPDIFMYPNPILTQSDVIRALIAEIRRLKGIDNSSK